MGQFGTAGLVLSAGNLLAIAVDGFTDRLGIEQNQHRVGGVVEYRFQAGMQQRLEELDPLEVDGVLQIFLDGPPPVGRDLQLVAARLQTRSDVCQHLVGQQDLP